MSYRKTEINIFQKVGVDKETYKILKDQKKKQKKSMVRIVKNLVVEKYG